MMQAPATASGPSDDIVRRLAKEILLAGGSLIPEDFAERIARALEGTGAHNIVELAFPRSVNVSLRTELADLRYVRCSKCGKVYDLETNPHLTLSLKCQSCRSSLVPAPIWAITSQNLPIRPQITPQDNIKIVFSVEDYSRNAHYHLQRIPPGEPPTNIRIRDRARPVATLAFDYRRHKYTDPNVRMALRERIFVYMLSLMPSESVSKPVSITAFSYNEESAFPVKLSVGGLGGVEEVLFCRDLEVLQATVGYYAGNPRAGTRSRVFIEEAVPSPYSGASVTRLFVRYIRTQGLVVRVDENALNNALENLGMRRGNTRNDNKYRWRALHTLSHAFLVSLPQVVGLEGTDFGEALSVANNEIAVYDNAPGGLGGIEGVVQSYDSQELFLDPNYEMRIREAADCALECIKACKACLYTDSCYMLNWNLDRRILIEMGWSAV